MAGYDALRDRLSFGSRTATDAPSAAMYRRIRLRLTLLYAAVLAIVLLVASGLLYFGMWQTVMGPVNSGLSNAASGYAATWQRVGPPCFPGFNHPGDGGDSLFVACYDTGASFLGARGPVNSAPGFLNPSLARSALKDGSDSDVIDGGNVGGYDLGAISRYALAVRDPDTHQVLGVIQVGVLTQGQLNAMDALLHLLLILGPLELLGATIGGFFLAERALAPARLAFERQQTFIADASHELRTPLTLLRADAEVLLRGRARFDPDDTALLEDIVVETEHLSASPTTCLRWPGSIAARCVWSLMLSISRPSPLTPLTGWTPWRASMASPSGWASYPASPCLATRSCWRRRRWRWWITPSNTLAVAAKSC